MMKYKKAMENLSFSILGDSYSTYKGWIPEEYECWYSDEGNDKFNNVSSVEDTWWFLLAKESKMTLLINNSYSGSTICNTGYLGVDYTDISFITRMKKDFGDNKTSSTQSDIIFIFGGTNDSWADAPIGTLKYSNWLEKDFKEVLPSFCYMVNYLKLNNPNARVINIVNTDLKDEITKGMESASKYYGIENLVLSDVDKENGHPNKNGMIQIKDQVLKRLILSQ